MQIGVALMDGEAVLASDEYLLKPPRHFKTGRYTREYDATALDVSGLTLAQLEDEGLSPVPACERLERWAVQNEALRLPVVAFNISYDYECYGQMLFEGGHFDRSIFPGVYRGYPEILGHVWICASRLARTRLAGELDTFSLDDVARHFDLGRTGDKHPALEDAILAGRVFVRMERERRLAEVGA